MKQRYHITGMTCSACSSHVEKSCSKLEGVERASVNLLTETMEITYDEEQLTREAIVEAVEKAGYGAELMTGVSAGNKEKGQPGRRSERSLERGREQLRKKAGDENRSMKWRLGISVAFLLLLMYVAMYHMYYEWFGLPIPSFVSDSFYGNENAMNFALTQFLLLLPILYLNRKFFSVGYKALAHLSPNMDSLIALGASAAVGYGIFAMYCISYGLGHGDMELVEHYSHDLYFESAGMILTLITVGKYLESRSKGKTGEAITKLMDLSPKTAILLTEDGEEKEVPTEELCAGDIFLVKPGASIPVDGVVLEGSSSVDEASITGESEPVEKQAGDKVVSATMNKAGFLKCRASRVGEDTTLSQIIRLVEEAAGSKAPIARLADKVAGVFVPVVIAIALVTFSGWLMAGAGMEFAVSSAIAVLVISCPCALGLATPVAIMVGTGVGASHGILIKSGEALQRAQEVDTVVLDKTGTITTGKLRVHSVDIFVPELSMDCFVRAAAALEKKSEHPLAEAVVEYAGQQGLSVPQVTDFKAVFGRGVEGVLAEDLEAGEEEEKGPRAVFTADGRTREAALPVKKGIRAGTKFLVGNEAFLTENKIALTPENRKGIAALADEGMTPLLVADGKRLLGVIGVMDQVKKSSGEAVKAWHKMGIRIIMLTGDNKRTAEAVRRRLKLEEAVAEVLPQEKEQKISALKAAGRRVAMIGDGINDAPALAAADVGMAIGAGTDVAIESADIVLVKNDLRDAVTAIKLSHAVIRNIKQNLFWAFFYNSIGIPLAAGLFYPAFQIRLNPMFGAAAMSLSSIFVVVNALRLKGFRGGQRMRRAESGMFSAEEAAGRNRRKEIGREENTGQAENQEEERNKIVKKTMKIEGMMCGHCTGRVQKALEAVEGVREVTMSLEKKSAAVTAEEGVTEEILTVAVKEAGYEVTEITEDSGDN